MYFVGLLPSFFVQDWSARVEYWEDAEGTMSQLVQGLDEELLAAMCE